MILVRKLNGRKIVTSDAKEIGEVGGAYVDTESMKITHLSVDLNDAAIELFGYKKPRIPMIGSVSVCLPVTTIQKVGDIITLNAEFEELPSLPIDQCKM
ncbi:MAG: PRC-barrel domain-containing protein [Candidatus Bathyarchaeota archaeon]